MWLKKKATASEPAQAAAADPTAPRFAMQVASGRIRALARNTMPLGTLALPPHLATSEQTLWLSAAFYGVLIAADRKSGTSIKVVEIVTASVLCSLALVNVGS
jgi:hypothetical protein